ncbi:MAG: sigma-70 family RNA polymerase sigma factor [Bryobacteraceae bacterium]|jgi:RNA polymerase sigma-70 factor (ECF subfamily)
MKDLAALATVAPMDAPDERLDLIEAARAGDLTAFEAIVRQYERLVLVTALRLSGDMEDAKDASQDVFLRLYRNLGKLERAGNVAAWLYRVTVNVCHDARRKRPVEAPVEELEAVPSATHDPLRAAGDTERRRALDLSLRMLPERERAAVVLRDLEGLSTGEVARVMGTNEATVRSQICQARVKMRGFLEGYFRRRS